MRRAWGLPLITLALAAGTMFAATTPAAAAPAAAAPVPHPGGPASGLAAPGPGSVTSTNWSGYAATGGTGAFTSVSADWTQPSGSCVAGSQAAAFWVGLDGFSSSSVEQIGADVDCVAGTPEYYAWYEMYPGPAHTFSSPVKPGDHLAASVAYTGGSGYRLSMTDSTQGWTKTENASLSGASRSSAEVIVEAPGAIPLTDFGRVTFTSAMVNGAGLCSSDPTQIDLASGGDSVGPIIGCTKFTVTWV